MLDTEKYEDSIREEKVKAKEEFSPYCDFRLVPSSVTEGVSFAIRVLKPQKPSFILLGTHGWHMSIPRFTPMDAPKSDYLTVDVDMRGRAFSTGKPDCNGLELYDIYDAYRFVLREYSDYIIEGGPVYFESGSGGGGNALAVAGKFPDLFSAVNSLSPMADYEAWYRGDEIGEFRDEMDVWIGKTPDEDKEAYAARSGVTVIPNLLTSVQICHGTTDIRVPFPPSEVYYQKAKALGKRVSLLRLHGVGTRDHYGNITPRQQQLMASKCKQNLTSHRDLIEIPPTGEFLVAGFLVTKHFEVWTDVDRVVRIRYDLSTRTVTPIDTHAPIRVEWKS